jgi:hypothetical protein
MAWRTGMTWRKEDCAVVLARKLAAIGVVFVGMGMAGLGMTADAAEPDKPRVLTRLIWQDEEARQVKTADLLAGDTPTLSAATTVPGFPTLDAKRQSLVQMEAAAGMVLVGVRDDDGGKFQSGWVLIEAGVREEEHGDHSHWYYPKSARVRAAQLNDKQGNPAHLYQYDESFFVANDQLNGFTWLNPKAISEKDDAAAIQKKAAFHLGGGGHITLAAADNRYVWSTWIDREGDNVGRVDLVALNPAGNKSIARTFKLPSGGTHGATFSSGKVFFAPTDGICWISTADQSPTPKVEHISLGKDGEKPRRTGAFTTYRKQVLFTVGAGETASLAFLDASAAAPVVTQLPIKMAKGNRPGGLEVVRPRKGSPLAFVFHEHAADVDAPNLLSIIELDPNGDDRWNDAKIALELEVGPAKVEGHGGHHSLTVDADRRRAVIGNPGDGTAWVMTLDDRKIVAKLNLGGNPCKLVAVGGRSSDH